MKRKKNENEQRTKKDSGTVYDKEITLDEWYDIYMKLFVRELKPQTIAVYESAYLKYFKEPLGDKIIRCITEEDLLYIKYTMLDQGLTQNTVVSKFEILGKLLNKSIDKGIITLNPMRGLKLKLGEAKKTKRALTMEELDYIYRVVRAKYSYLEPLFIFLQNTGCRIGEAAAIEWKDISEDMRFVSISKTRTYYYIPSQGQYKVNEDSPKNMASKRTVPLNDTVMNMLIKLRETRKKNGMYAPDTKVFLSKQHRPIRAKTVSQQFKRICEIIREKYSDSFPNVTSHWLRHTFASYGVENNIPSIYLQKICGWADGAMLSKIYAHMNERQALEAVKNIYPRNN